MNWETRTAYGTPITPRGYHVSFFHDSRIYVLGGYNGKTVFDDVYMLGNPLSFILRSQSIDIFFFPIELSASAYLAQITNFELETLIEKPSL